MVAIVDSGMANLRSVQKAFEHCGQTATIIRTPEEIRKADRVVVPGVGAFKDASRVLYETGLADAIKEFVATGKPFLGICLGLQLLADTGHEDGVHKGLGIIPGEVLRFSVDQPPLNLKVPHMGWNAIKWSKNVPIFRNLPNGSYVYFVHSYHIVPKNADVIAARADYGGEFAAAIWKDNVYATQFHPEKSQQVGGVILKNFAEL